MIRRQNNIISYTFIKDNKTYYVTMKRLPNTLAGCPRHEALITETCQSGSSDSTLTAVYTFTGHYLSERDEAEFILRYYLSELDKQ